VEVESAFRSSSYDACSFGLRSLEEGLLQNATAVAIKRLSQIAKYVIFIEATWRSGSAPGS
jgi:hypothetical protein